MERLAIAGLPAERITDDMVERRLYARDLAPVPAILSRPFFQTLPDAVVRPANAGQVAEVLRHAARERIGVTPRAAASTAFFNTVPVRGGLVLDVNDLRDGLDLDAARLSVRLRAHAEGSRRSRAQTVRVLPATTWFELDDALQRHGLAVKSYPSSALSATVGGWVSMQGHGIGSLRYGSLGSQLVSLEVVLPGGEIRTVTCESEPPLDWFVAAEGTLGVITQVELTVRPRPEAEAHHLFAFDDLDRLGASLVALARCEPRPFTVFFADAGYFDLLAQAGLAAPVTQRGVLLVNWQGEPVDVRRGQEGLTRLPGRELPSEWALEEWSLRLYHLRAKRAGPSLLAAEQWLPVEAVHAYLAAVRALTDRRRLLIGTYGLVVSPEQALVMTIYPADERRTLAYLAAIGFTKRLHDLGARYGGWPYGVGLWNTAYLGRLFSRAQRAELQRRKAQLDPDGLMNPGKLYRALFPLWPITFGPGAGVLGMAHLALGRRRP